jgi:uracil-DNA glycosylase
MTGFGTSPQEVLTAVKSCRLCVEHPRGKPLPHPPRPVLQFSEKARILIAGQAPGTRVHASGRPFTDPSGDRLRRWLGLGEDVFYDATRLAILPMGFCFPGLSPAGADLPPRRECAPHWRSQLMAHLGAIRLIVTLGLPAAQWHLNDAPPASLAEGLASWRRHLERAPPLVMLPHPSWRNNALLNNNPWIEAEIIPALQGLVRRALD